MARSKPCPLCGKPPSAAHAPFCSPGCRDRDLMQWLSEGYAIPVATPPAHEDFGEDAVGAQDGLDRPRDAD